MKKKNPKKMSKKKLKKKIFQNIWTFEALTDDPTYSSRRMFGGLSIYLKGKMVLVLAESPGDRTYRDAKFDFDIWDGLLLPTSRKHHESLCREFPALRSHPVLGKWLYWPAQLFEEDMDPLIQRIKRGDPRFGIYPGLKKKQTKV